MSSIEEVDLSKKGCKGVRKDREQSLVVKREHNRLKRRM